MSVAVSEAPPRRRRATGRRWVAALPLAELEAGGRAMVRRGGRQIALFVTAAGVRAIANRCPHEGYPLSEGTFADGCALTCNWHNWKFDLATGDNLTGGDRLRVYPAHVEDGRVYVDVADPPAAERRAAALEALHEAFDDGEFDRFDRLAREIARYEKAGGDPLDTLRAAVRWTCDRLEDGTGHAYAAAADWLRLRDTAANDPALRLVPLLEAVAHANWDTFREPRYPFASAVAPWDEDAFVAAVDAEDEAGAVARMRGALADGRGWDDVERAFARAALAHYQDFGHSAIYTVKTGELLERLGPETAEPLLLALTRSITKAFREDMIPEFRTYAEARAGFGGAEPAPTADDFAGLRPRQAMARVAAAAAPPEALFDALLEASSRHLLWFDLAVQDATDRPVDDNQTWLSVTHEITFANAARRLAARYPELWPDALLQMACFVGRNEPYMDRGAVNPDDWRVDDPVAFVDAALAQLFDHGQREFIVTAHLVKTLTAARDEMTRTPDAPWVPTLAAGLNRFLNSPLKRRHPLRTARQALDFVARED